MDRNDHKDKDSRNLEGTERKAREFSERKKESYRWIHFNMYRRFVSNPWTIYSMIHFLAKQKRIIAKPKEPLPLCEELK